MQSFFDHLPSLIKASWQGAVLILLVLAAQWVFGRRLSPRWRYALWILVLIRLALPWTVPSPASLFNLLRFPGSSASITETPQLLSGAPEPAIKTTYLSAYEKETSAPAASAPQLASTLPWFLLVWCGGAFALAACLVFTHYQTSRKVAPC